MCPPFFLTYSIMDPRDPKPNQKLSDLAEYFRGGPQKPMAPTVSVDLNAAHQAPTDETLGMQRKMQQIYERRNRLQQALDAGEVDERDLDQAMKMMQDLNSQAQGITAQDQQRKPELFQEKKPLFPNIAGRFK